MCSVEESVERTAGRVQNKLLQRNNSPHHETVKHEWDEFNKLKTDFMFLAQLWSLNSTTRVPFCIRPPSPFPKHPVSPFNPFNWKPLKELTFHSTPLWFFQQPFLVLFPSNDSAS